MRKKVIDRLMDLTKKDDETEELEFTDEEIKKRIADLKIPDTHSKECLLCGLKTDFIFSDGKCELCREVKKK